VSLIVIVLKCIRRAKAVAPKLATLNPYVDVQTSLLSLTDEDDINTLTQYTVSISLDTFTCTYYKWSLVPLSLIEIEIEIS